MALLVVSIGCAVMTVAFIVQSIRLNEEKERVGIYRRGNDNLQKELQERCERYYEEKRALQKKYHNLMWRIDELLHGKKEDNDE